MKKKKTGRIIIALICLAVIIVLDIWGFSMTNINYTVSSEKLDKDIRVVFISDLHNCIYGGRDQSELMAAVDSAQPDIVLFGGDVIDAWSKTDNALTIMKMVHEKYPCAYTPGNHEEMREKELSCCI